MHTGPRGLSLNQLRSSEWDPAAFDGQAAQRVSRRPNRDASGVHVTRRYCVFIERREFTCSKYEREKVERVRDSAFGFGGSTTDRKTARLRECPHYLTIRVVQLWVKDGNCPGRKRFPSDLLLWKAFFFEVLKWFRHLSAHNAVSAKGLFVPGRERTRDRPCRWPPGGPRSGKDRRASVKEGSERNARERSARRHCLHTSPLTHFISLHTHLHTLVQFIPEDI